MDLNQLTELFEWMTIINVGVFVFSAILIMLLRKFICKMHGRMFGIDEDKISIILYGYLGIYKIIIIVFIIIPYISLLLIS